jgi:hypothetical protein
MFIVLNVTGALKTKVAPPARVGDGGLDAEANCILSVSISLQRSLTVLVSLFKAGTVHVLQKEVQQDSFVPFDDTN